MTILLTGIFHGLSGTGHVLGVIPALSYKNLMEGASYLFAFCVGTTIAMSIFTSFVGLIGIMVKNQSNSLPKKLSFVASIFAVFLGIVMIFAATIE